jgi:pyruvate formate-lyase 1-activating enzyme
LRFLDYVCSIDKPLWIRHVVVPGITYNEAYLNKLADFIKTLPTVEKVDVLAYHTMGVFKWQQMGMQYPLEGVPPLSQEEFKKAKQIFIDKGLAVT